MKTNLNLNDDQLKALEQLAGDFFKIEECAVVLQVDEAKLKYAIQDKESKAHEFYWRGRMTEVARHRKNVKELANRGSSPAQALVEKFIDQST